MRTRTLCAVLVCLLQSACEAPAPGPKAKLWTVFDLAAAWSPEARIAKGADPLFPQGFRLDSLLASAKELKVSIAFSEGAPAAYVSAELWANVPAVWLQPMYVFRTPDGVNLPGAKPIFSVGPHSGFYSPFWKVFYVTVPVGTDKDQYKNTKQVFDDHLPLQTGPNKLCVLLPPDTNIKGAPNATRPLFGDRIGATGKGQGWVDGVAYDVIDFGVERFSANNHGEIEADPLFVFAVKGDGGPRRLGVPNVGGVGPLFAKRDAVAPSNRPLFGSLWRLHVVTLPPSAGVFVPPDSDFDFLRPEPGTLRAPPAAAAAIPDVKDFAGRVALNPDCFADADFPKTCTWLDSQASIEKYLPQNITPSEILMACPLVTFAGKPAPLPPAPVAPGPP